MLRWLTLRSVQISFVSALISASSSSLTYDFPFLKILLNMNEHSTMAFNINATVTAVAPAYAAINASL